MIIILSFRAMQTLPVKYVGETMTDLQRKVQPQLHLISDGRRPFSEFVQIVRECGEWIDYVHIREKTSTAAEIVEAIEQLQAVLFTEKIIVNDRIDAAIVCGIRHIQLASHSIDVEQAKHHFPSCTFGCSVHSLEEARFMEKKGADRLIFGHVYATGSKPGLPPRGISALAQITQAVAVPVIAIGGIQPDRVPEVIRAGAAGIAIMSGILDAADPYEAAYAYKQALEQSI